MDKIDSLIHLDDDVIKNAAIFLNSTKDLSALSCTCRTTHRFFDEVIQPKGAKELLELILHGEAERAMQLISKAPHLLFIKSQAQDFALSLEGKPRTIIASPFQAILGAGDIPLLKWLEQQAFFNDYQSQMMKQFDEQFPRATAHIYSDSDYDAVAKLLNDLANVIDRDSSINGKYNLTTGAALKEFRDYFAPGEVTTGLHFDLRILVMALETYVHNYAHWFTQSSTCRAQVFWSRVVGYLERMISTVDAQAFCDGLSNVVEDNEINLAERKLTLKQKKGTFFQTDPTAPMCLGVSHAVYSISRGGFAGHVVQIDDKFHGGFILRSLLKLWHLKKQGLESFRAGIAHAQRLRCI